MSAWVRDEILQVILQHRMQENLTTFFTSNFEEDLERHLQLRVMEMKPGRPNGSWSA